MTEEELAHEREIDHRHYARRVAAKKVAEQAERTAILQGTPYENVLHESKADEIAS